MNKACKCHPSSKKQRWVLADFGFASMLDSKPMIVSSKKRGTDSYRAPELTFGCSERFPAGMASRKSDIWSLGCLLFYLATTGEAKAFPNDHWAVLFSKRYEGYDLPQLNERLGSSLSQETLCPRRGLRLPIWKQINSILKMCFARIPDQRPSAFELRQRFQEMREAFIN